jgi:hypothetical protein
LAVRRDVTIEGLAGDADLAAELADPGFPISHRRLRKPEFGRCHFVGRTTATAAGTRGAILSLNYLLRP